MLLILITPPKITDYTILNMYIHTVGETKTGEPKMPNSFNAINQYCDNNNGLLSTAPCMFILVFFH